MRSTRTVAAVAVMACGLAGAALWAQNPMRPGQWEVITQMQMANVPMQMPEMKSLQCVTAEQVKDPAKSLPSGPGSGNCKITDYKSDGTKVTWKTACDGIAGTGELTFQGDSYTGTVGMTSPKGDMTMKMRGKRLGDCAP